MNSKLKNAFLGAVLATSVSACTTSMIKKQPIEVDTRPPEPEPPSQHHTLEIRNKITMFGTEKFLNQLRETEKIIAQTANDNLQHIINITINSPGGNVREGYRLIDAFENSHNNFHFKCEDQASSMAAIVLISATGKNRDAEDDCTIMIHQSYFSIYEPRDSDNFITTTIYKYLEPHYQEVKENPDIQKVRIQQPGSPDYDLSRAEILNWFERLAKYREIVKDRLSETTYLTPDDIEFMLESGDQYFSVNSAAFAGMIDTIEGTYPTSAQLQQGQKEFCNNLSSLSLCA